MSKNKGMSKEMYDFILNNKDRLEYNLEEGTIKTPMGTKGTVCTSTGYLRVKVNKKTLQVHQILSVIYYGESNIGMTVNHKDGNKLNNKKSNLELLSLEDNIKEGFKTGLYNSLKKKIVMMDMQGNELMCFNSKEDACRYLNVKNESQIRRCLRGYEIKKGNKINVKSAHGFKWKEI